MLTLGDLRKLDLPDDTPVVVNGYDEFEYRDNLGTYVMPAKKNQFGLWEPASHLSHGADVRRVLKIE